MSTVIKERKDVKAEDKWRIEDLFSSVESWEKEFKACEELLPLLKEYKGRLAIENMFDIFGLDEKISKMADRLYVYANLKSHENTADSFYQGLCGRANSLIVKYSSACAFIEPELLSLNEEDIVKAAEDSVYKHFLLNLLRNKRHILDTEKEELLAGVYELASAPDDIFSMINNADIQFDDVKDGKGKTVPLTHGKYQSYLESSDRTLRENAFKSYYKSFYNLRNTISTTYAASVKKDIFLSRARNYESCLEAGLYGDNIPVDVYKSLISTVNKNLSLLQRYIKIRKDRLKVDKLHFYDLYTPIVDEVDIKIDFERAKETVTKALEPMGEEYIKTFKEGLEGCWIDKYENKGKRSGAYSWGSYGTHPYVLLNYDNNYNSMFTLAHEMGHAMHSHYTWSNQPYVYGNYTIFVAEVASTVNEALLMEYLLKTTEDKKLKAYLINYFMEQFRGTLFRQTMFAEFELTAHEMAERGEAITFETLTEVYRQLNIKYFGDGIELDDEICYEWMRIPHFYTPFYVYQYATGYSCAIALSRKILNENVAENYIKFLKGGCSDFSINLLKTAGVDISTPKPVENAVKVFENLLNQMESLE
ncbi:MAG: oligoendopeptidase F [Clostridiales bacterium]|nr:oligoendopeptidase F [Clostridiales bacterium]